jgi:hypothetical protein
VGQTFGYARKLEPQGAGFLGGRSGKFSGREHDVGKYTQIMIIISITRPAILVPGDTRHDALLPPSHWGGMNAAPQCNIRNQRDHVSDKNLDFIR